MFLRHFHIYQPDYTASYHRRSQRERWGKGDHSDIEIFCVVLKEEHKDGKTRHPHLAFTSHTHTGEKKEQNFLLLFVPRLHLWRFGPLPGNGLAAGCTSRRLSY